MPKKTLKEPDWWEELQAQANDIRAEVDSWPEWKKDYKPLLAIISGDYPCQIKRKL